MRNHLRGADADTSNELRSLVCGWSHVGYCVHCLTLILTSMQVKEALFSILVEFDVMRDDAIALDTFSGCGSVGIEALSRGVCVSACMCVCSAVSSFVLRSQELTLFVGNVQCLE